MHDAVEPVLAELNSRMGLLDRVGLGYLTLDRTTRTLSGGEARRVRLSANLGSELVGVNLRARRADGGFAPARCGPLDRGPQGTARPRQYGHRGGARSRRHAPSRLDHRPGPWGRRARWPLGGHGAARSHRGLRRVHNRRVPARGFGLERLERRREPAQPAHGRLAAPAFAGSQNPQPQGRGPGRALWADHGIVRTVRFGQVLPGARYPGARLERQAKRRPLDQGSGTAGRRPTHIGGRCVAHRAHPRAACRPPMRVSWIPCEPLFVRTPDARMHGFTLANFSFNSAKGRCAACEGLGSTKVEMQFPRGPVARVRGVRRQALSSRDLGRALSGQVHRRHPGHVGGRGARSSCSIKRTSSRSWTPWLRWVLATCVWAKAPLPFRAAKPSASSWPESWPMPIAWAAAW